LKIKSFRDLDVFKNAFEAGMEIFKVSKKFPGDERYSMTSQIRRCSRSVCANIGEAWRKRRFYEKHFVSKLSDSDSEATETQVWLLFAKNCGYLGDDTFQSLYDKYDKICAQLVRMMENPDQWCENVGKRRVKKEDEETRED